MRKSCLLHILKGFCVVIEFLMLILGLMPEAIEISGTRQRAELLRKPNGKFNLSGGVYNLMFQQSSILDFIVRFFLL